MNRSWPVHPKLVSWLLALATASIIGSLPSVHPATSSNPSDNSAFVAANPNVPKGLLDIMGASRSKYLEGSSHIKSGDSDQARECFNRAVDIVLECGWDMASTTALQQFFQDLIQRIKEDESRYLLAPFDPEEEEEEGEEIEEAVMDELNDLDLFPIAVDPSLESTFALDLANTKYEIPITMNEWVAKSLNYWLNGGRKHFIDGLVRSGQYRPMIEKVFREESVPLDLMYLAQVESLFKTHALSRAKAKGIWQFERATAVRYGLKVTRDVDERSDPEKSTRAAARYLNDLFDMFKDWNLALAAYNWGEGRVQRLIKSTGLNDFWQLVNLRKRVPRETKNHVPLIQASVILGKNPEKYGLPTELDPPLKYAEVSVSKPIDLRAVAKVLSTSIEELKRLNPSLRGLTTPANYPNFQLKVPIESDPDLHQQLASLPAAKVRLPAEFDRRYKVKRGDTLSGIAARYRVSVRELQRANGLSSKNKVRAGMWLQVPSAPAGTTKTTASKGTANTKKAASAKSKAKATTSSAKTQGNVRKSG